MRSALTIVLALLIAAPAFSAEEPPLTRRERKDRMAKLPDEYRQFLLDVEPIMIDKERDTFLRLETNPQRDAFIDDFWRRRDVAQGTTNDSARKEYYVNLEYVKENFGQVSSDRGRIYLVDGPPAAIVDIKCSLYFQPLQVWQYAFLPGFGHDYSLLFYIPRNERVYRLWNPPISGNPYADLISNSVESTGHLPDNVIYDCENGQDLVKAMAQMMSDKIRITKLYDPPPVNEEDVNRILRSMVRTTPGAPKLAAAEMSAAYPGGDGNKTDTQLTIYVPRSELKTTSAGDTAVYTLEVVGEILRDEKLWERYRYRFDYPADVTSDKLPVVIDRMLHPGTYKARVKLTDPASGAETILESDLTVPAMAAVAKVTEESTALDAIQEGLQSTRVRLRILPLGDGVISGVQTIQTLVSGSGIKAVEFWLDGQKIASRRVPPYTLDLDFGNVPRARHIRAVAIDSHDQPITGDEIVVNIGNDPFQVRIVSPRIAPKLKGPTRVELEVKVPAGKELGEVELYWNETRVATMFDPPFVQTVNIPSENGVGYLRAVAALKDPDADPVEDVVMVNAPDFMETVNVHLVELPTTVLRDGKPVNDLGESAFKVLDEGQPVTISKFEHVSDLALSIGMAVDTSASMDERMATARNAGAAFFDNVLKKGDKAFLIAFDSQPHLIQKWSDDLHDLRIGLARLQPEESTALYDAIVYSLYNFQGVKGQKALVVLTDGKDTVSKFTYEQALEYAQRSAVPIYTVGIGIKALELARSRLNHFAADTGGTPYYIDDVQDLGKIYTDIQNELRSQYLLGFYPSAEVKPGGKWRELTVQVAEGKVKTIRGYYP